MIIKGAEIKDFNHVFGLLSMVLEIWVILNKTVLKFAL